nr:thioesterase family protein [Motiliproteus sediminis]
MDALGHLNNVAYFRLMEEARVQWLESLDVTLSSHEEGVVVVNVSCDFLRQVHYPATIRLHSFVDRIGRSSIDLHQRMYIEGGPEEPCAEGHSRIVWIDFKTARSAPIPAWLRQRLEAARADTHV